MNAIELGRAGRVEVATGGRRNVLEGELLVTPVKSLKLTDDGRAEVLRPGRDRLAPFHPVVRQRPELFEPAMRGDRATASRMRELLGRAGREVDAELRRRGSTRRRGGTERWRLSARTPRRESWRLN